MIRTRRWHWLVIVAAILFSAYGQFYNQVDDYDVDKAAGLKNTVVLLGKPLTRALSLASLLGSLGLHVGSDSSRHLSAMAWHLYDHWIRHCHYFPWELDMRGNLATDGGNVQRPGLIVANLLALVWLASSMGIVAIG